jgi:hypothetical protein
MDWTGSTLIIVIGNPEGHVPLTEILCDYMERIWKKLGIESF